MLTFFVVGAWKVIHEYSKLHICVMPSIPPKTKAGISGLNGVRCGNDVMISPKKPIHYHFFSHSHAIAIPCFQMHFCVIKNYTIVTNLKHHEKINYNGNSLTCYGIHNRFRVGKTIATKTIRLSNLIQQDRRV